MTLLVALQIPQLADHYQQFLAGYYEATKIQIEGYQANAARHEYADVYAMIEEHLNNNVASVRVDAQQKLDALNEFAELEKAVALFRTGSVITKAIYMFNPKRFSLLEKTWVNFEPGIPMNAGGLLFGIIAGFIINLVVVMPVYLVLRRKRKIVQSR